MIECLLFDLFGTLVEYEPERAGHLYPETCDLIRDELPALTRDQIIAGINAVFGKLELDSHRNHTEFHMNQVASGVCEHLGIEPEQSFCAAFVETYIREWLVPIKPVSGVTGLLHRLSKHYLLGVVSNTHYAPIVHQLITKMGLTEILEVVTLSIDVGVPKPNPEIFQLTLAALDLTAAQVVYIGDSYESDYRGARNAGIDCYLIGRHARVPRERQLRSILDLSIYFNTARQ